MLPQAQISDADLPKGIRNRPWPFYLSRNNYHDIWALLSWPEKSLGMISGIAMPILWRCSMKPASGLWHGVTDSLDSLTGAGSGCTWSVRNASLILDHPHEVDINITQVYIRYQITSGALHCNSWCCREPVLWDRNVSPFQVWFRP